MRPWRNSEYARGALYGLAAVCIWAGFIVVSRLAVTTNLTPWDVAAIRFSVAGLLCNVALATAALRLGGDLTAVAAGALASQSVYGAGVVGLAARAGGLPRPARFVGRCYAPLAWCFLAVVLAIQAAVIVGGSAAPLVAAAVYALLAWPVAQRAATHLRIGRPRPASDEDGS